MLQSDNFLGLDKVTKTIDLKYEEANFLACGCCPL